MNATLTLPNIGTAIDDYDGGRFPKHTRDRQAVARRLGAVEILDTRYELDASRLPADVRRALVASNCHAARIGSTTYRSSTWAIIPN